MKNEYSQLLGESYAEISNIYSLNGDTENSLEYNLKALDAFRASGHLLYQGSISLNTGYEYYTMNRLDTALILTNEAHLIFDSLDNEYLAAYAIGNKGLILAGLGDLDSADQLINNAIKKFSENNIAKIDEFLNKNFYNVNNTVHFFEKNIHKKIF